MPDIIPNEADDLEVELSSPIPGVDPVQGKPESDHDDDQGRDQDGGDSDQDDDDEQRGQHDEELAAAENEAEREKIREQRKRDRGNQRQRLKARNQDLHRALENQQAVIAELQRRVAAQETGNLNTRYASLTRAEQELEQARQQLLAIRADAVNNNDGARLNEADEGLQQIRDRAYAIRGAREQIERAASNPQRPPANPAVVANARAFMERNSWYKGPQAKDTDSRIVSMLDEELTAENWDPTSQSYWDELEARARKRLPDRFSSQSQERQGYNQGSSRTPRSPVAGSTSGTNGSGAARPNTVRLSAARVKAIQDAGLWDDQTSRERMIRRYVEQDALAKRT